MIVQRKIFKPGTDPKDKIYTYTEPLTFHELVDMCTTDTGTKAVTVRVEIDMERVKEVYEVKRDYARINNILNYVIKTNFIEESGEFHNYYPYLRGMVYTFETDTACTDGDFIYVNPEFIEHSANRLAGKTEDVYNQKKKNGELVNRYQLGALVQYKCLTFVVLHECYHMLYNHFERQKNKLGDRISKEAAHNCNVAMDAEINRDIFSYYPDLEECLNIVGGIRDDIPTKMRVWGDIYDANNKNVSDLPPQFKNDNNQNREKPKVENKSANPIYAEAYNRCVEAIKKGWVDINTFSDFHVNERDLPKDIPHNFITESIDASNWMTPPPGYSDYEKNIWYAGINDCIKKAKELENQTGGGGESSETIENWENLNDIPTNQNNSDNGNSDLNKKNQNQNNDQKQNNKSGQQGSDDNSNDQNGNSDNQEQSSDNSQSGGNNQQGSGDKDDNGSDNSQSGGNGQQGSDDGSDNGTDGSDNSQSGQGSGDSADNGTDGSDNSQSGGNGKQGSDDGSDSNSSDNNQSNNSNNQQKSNSQSSSQNNPGQNQSSPGMKDIDAKDMSDRLKNQKSGRDIVQGNDMQSKEWGNKVREKEGIDVKDSQRPDMSVKEKYELADQILKRESKKLGGEKGKLMDDKRNQIMAELMYESVVDWKRILKRIFNSYTDAVKSEMKLKFPRAFYAPSKFPVRDYEKEYTEAIPKGADVFYLVDSSGSVIANPDSLYRAFSEIITLEKKSGGFINKSCFAYWADRLSSDIRTWQSSKTSKTKILDMITYKKVDESAGYGTSLAPVIQEVMSLKKYYRKKKPQTILIIYTDGWYGDMSKVLSTMNSEIKRRLIFIIVNSKEALEPICKELIENGVPSKNVVPIIESSLY